MRYRSDDNRHKGDFLHVDYAAIARGYGAKAWTIRTEEELKKALAEAKKVKDVPVLFDIKVLPKSMTDGYGSWWRVGFAEVSNGKANKDACRDQLEHIKTARKY